MNHTSLLVQILQCFCDLRDDVAGQVFAEVRQTHDLVEKLATGAELENNEVILSGFREVDQLYNIGVVQLSHDLHLFQDVGALMKMTSVNIQNTLSAWCGAGAGRSGR